MKKLMLIVLIVAFAATTAVISFATPQKAKATGKACADCHGPKNKNGTDSGNDGNNKGPNVKDKK